MISGRMARDGPDGRFGDEVGAGDKLSRRGPDEGSGGLLLLAATLELGEGHLAVAVLVHLAETGLGLGLGLLALEFLQAHLAVAVPVALLEDLFSSRRPLLPL